MFWNKPPEVLVVGAGPVGQMGALALAQRGIRVQVIDKEWRPAAHSYALALHAETLDLFEEVGLLDKVLERAYRIKRIGFYEGEDRKAELDLNVLSSRHPFLAVMQQDVLETVIEQALRDNGVKVLWNHQAIRLVPVNEGVEVTIDKLVKESTGYAVAHTEWAVAKSKDSIVSYVLGADGYQSRVRKALGTEFADVGDPVHFAVFEFESDADLQNEMRLVMDDETTNVLWPLPNGRVRWSFQLLDFEAPQHARHKDHQMFSLGAWKFPVLTEEHLRTFIAERAPWFTGSIGRIAWRIAVRFQKRITGSFGEGRLWLAGDAGHMTGPVGIQSMNVGFREAAELGRVFTGVLRSGMSPDLLDAYGRERMAEWRFLVGLEGGLDPKASTDPWIAARADRLLPCIPASGKHLLALARQMGLNVSMPQSVEA